LAQEMKMSGHCDNCGCRKVSGYCTNCQEEAYIVFEQAPEMEFSEEFMQKAWEQQKEVSRENH
jgi:uncharacterized Zn finger protein (UPF0148 family)